VAHHVGRFGETASIRQNLTQNRRWLLISERRSGNDAVLSSAERIEINFPELRQDRARIAAS
jgi:hypothetical protein